MKGLKPASAEEEAFKQKKHVALKKIERDLQMEYPCQLWNLVRMLVLLAAEFSRKELAMYFESDSPRPR